MAWWEKGLKSVREQTEKVAFEADKMMRIRREEGTAGEIKAQLQAKLVDLGQAALALYHGGALNDPSIAGVAAEIAAMEIKVQEQGAKIEAIKAEQYQAPAGEPASAPAAPAAPAAAVPPQAPPAPAVPVAESSAAWAAGPVSSETPATAAGQVTTVTCPNCGAEQSSTTKFCTECGTRLKP
jgi:hypothetical protein